MHLPRHISDDPAMPIPREPGYRWYHAVDVGVAANLPSVAAGGAMGDRAYYESLRRPPGAYRGNGLSCGAEPACQTIGHISG
jgi:hypothetical protein